MRVLGRGRSLGEGVGKGEEPRLECHQEVGKGEEPRLGCWEGGGA